MIGTTHGSFAPFPPGGEPAGSSNRPAMGDPAADRRLEALAIELAAFAGATLALTGGDRRRSATGLAAMGRGYLLAHSLAPESAPGGWTAWPRDAIRHREVLERPAGPSPRPGVEILPGRRLGDRRVRVAAGTPALEGAGLNCLMRAA